MRVGIVGAGIIGLTCGYRLLKQGHDIVILEKDKEIGGTSSSFLTGGNFLEKYYQYIREDDYAFLELMDEFSLRSELLWFLPKRGIYYKNSINSYNTFGELLGFKGLNIIDRLRFCHALSQIKNASDWRNLESITAEKWLRNLGGDSLFRNIWLPLLKARFEGSYTDVSGVYLWEKYRNIEKRIGYCVGGFQRIIELIGQEIRFKNGSIKTSTLVKNISSTAKGLIKVVTDKGTMDFERLIVTTSVPAFITMAKDMPLEYNVKLSLIKYMSLVSMVLELKEPFGNNYITEICDLASPFSEIVEHTNLISSETYNGSSILYITSYVNPGSVYMNYTFQKFLEDYVPFLKRLNSRFDQTCIKKSNLFRTDNAYPILSYNYSKNIPDFKTPLSGIYLITGAQIYPEEPGLNSSIKLVNQAVEQIDFSGESSK